jgi:hypothetical protein
MKKIYLLLIISFLFTMGVYAQNSIRVYDLDVKMGHASDIARNFADYHDVERNSGVAVLQSVSFLDDVSHRIIFAGDPANWGSKVKKSDAQWEAYRSKQQLHLNSGGGSMVMTSLRWREEGDWEKSKASKYWEIIPEDPEQFLKAYDKFTKSIGDILDWRIVSLTSIDMGGLGGTHTTSLKGSDLNDIILIEREIQKTKAFKEFLAERGNVKLVKSYYSNTIYRFNKR